MRTIVTAILAVMLFSCGGKSDPISMGLDQSGSLDALDNRAQVDVAEELRILDLVDVADTGPEVIDVIPDEVADLLDLPPDLPLEIDIVDVVEVLEVDVHDIVEIEIFDVSDIDDIAEIEEVEPEVEVIEEVEPGPDCEGFAEVIEEEPGTMLTVDDFVMVGKAEPDEIFITEDGQEIPKTNQAYVWSMTRGGNSMWVGTMSNTLCLAFTGFGGVSIGYATDNAFCQQSTAEDLFPDWRMPLIWEYKLDTKEWLQHKAPEGTEENPGISVETQGWRAAISYKDYVFFAGPGTGLLWGMPGYGTSLIIFKDGQYIGSQKFEESNDVRRFEEYGGQLYMGSQYSNGDGIIMRWIGDDSAPPESLFQWETVGVIDSSAAWLTGDKERVYSITWSTAGLGGGTGFQVWRSPKIPPCGLTAEHQDQWEMVFDYGDYDTNPDTNKLSAGGAMEVFKGELYFGSMHVPFNYGCTDPGNLITCALEKYINTSPISVFKLKEKDDGSIDVTCLFGQDKGGIYQPTIGPMGLGNHYANYTWAFAVHDGWFYFGTMDYSFFMADALTAYGMPTEFPGMVPYQQFGFDLWATSDGANWVPVTINGLGNMYNWGARNLLSDGESLWLGTANPFNLNPAGGWELWQAPSPGDL